MSPALQINSMYYTLKEYAQLVIHVLEVIQKKNMMTLSSKCLFVDVAHMPFDLEWTFIASS